MNLVTISEINQNLYINKELSSKMVNNFVYKFENLSPSESFFIV